MNSEIPSFQPAPDDWQHLKAYGYAPGDYMSRCSTCGTTPIMDKRAWRCRPCAEVAYAMDPPAPAPIPAPGGAELPEPYGYAWHEGVVTAGGGYSAGFGFDTSKPPDDYEAAPLYSADQMRAALAAQPTAPNLACPSVQARLAAQWGYVKVTQAPAEVDERAAFEDWYTGKREGSLHRWDGEGREAPSHLVGAYLEERVNQAWKVWQAARAAPASKVQPKGLDADALRKALAAFVSDREYVASRYGVWRDGEGESVGSFKSFDEAVAAMPELQNKYGDGLSITGWNHGVLAGSVDYRDLFSTAGTAECPICYEQGPHEHSGLEIHRHRESEAELRPLRDKRRAEILARVANIEKNYSARPRLDAAVAAVHAALAAVPSPAVKAEGVPYGWLYDWTHSSALGKPDEEFTGFTTDESYARGREFHRNVRPVYLAAVAPRDETAWLIEVAQSPTLYWDGSLHADKDRHRDEAYVIPNMQPDASKAVRFPTKQAAEKAFDSFYTKNVWPMPIRVLGRDCYRIAEHMWPASQPPVQPTGGANG